MDEKPTRPFALRTVLTVTTGRLLTIVDLYEILDWMTGDSNFTHQLPRVMKECAPWLLRWFPELARVDDARQKKLPGRPDEAAIKAWLKKISRALNLEDTYEVPRIPAGYHERKDPCDELVAMRGTDGGIIVVGPPES